VVPHHYLRARQWCVGIDREVKKLRKVNRQKRKQQRKDAQEALKQQTAAFLDHPKECCVCEEKFERTRETVKSWQVTVIEERVRLTCPACWHTLTEVLECQE